MLRDFWPHAQFLTTGIPTAREFTLRKGGQTYIRYITVEKSLVSWVSRRFCLGNLV